MTTLTDADFLSNLIDLTMIPLDDLRDVHTPDLDAAILRVYEHAEFNTGNELQEQRP